MARAARNLPSLFNESKIIFGSLISSLFLLVMGLGVTFGTSSPTASPSMSYIVYLVMILFVVLQSTLQLLMPKLKMARRSEVIIVSNVMSEHAQQVREKQARRSTESSFSSLTQNKNIHITGLNHSFHDSDNNFNMTRRRQYSTSSFSLEFESEGTSTLEKPQQAQPKQQQQRDITRSVSAAEITRSGSFNLPEPAAAPISGVRFSLPEQKK